MKLKSLGANKTQLEFSDGTMVLFSYRTPVAMIDNSGRGYKTSKFWSRTTRKHISTWLGPTTGVSLQAQEFFDMLVAGVTL